MFSWVLKKIVLHAKYQRINIPHKYKNWKKRIFHNYKEKYKLVPVVVDGVEVSFYCTSQRAINRANGVFKSEPSTVRWILENFNDNDVFYDIGANVGVFTLLAATKITNGRIYSFEPHSVTFHSLLKNVEINNFGSRVITSSFAVHEKLDFLDFNYVNMMSATTGSQFGDFTNLDVGRDCKVKELKVGVSLDYLLERNIIKPPKYIKIDVDGNESLILKGMTKLLESKNKPYMVLVEVRDSTRSEISGKFERCGYHIHDEVVYGSVDSGLGCEYNIIYKYDDYVDL